VPILGTCIYARRVPEVDTAEPLIAAAADNSGPAVSATLTAPVKFRYHGSLDGLRALAVLAIIAYHYNYPWARGAYLSVDLFLILSGFLITTLLLMEWRRSDHIALRDFWSRRARRLLPALLILLVFVAIMTVTTIAPWNRASIRDDGIASLFYVANWRFIAAKESYFDLFAAASPLRHMWTLAIEEQFYLVWPLVTYAALRVARGSLRVLTAVCVTGIIASVAVMMITFRPGDPLRAYYGTDARAHTILMGALLAILLFVWTPGAAAKRRLRVASVVAFVVMIYAWRFATDTSPRYYHGGSVAYAALACVVIAGALQPGALRAALSFRPLAWIGRLSYGIYLFHWPLIVLLVPTRLHGLHGLPLNLVRLAATFAAATVSFYLVELPIRERRRPTLPWHPATRPERGARPARRRTAVRWVTLSAVAGTFAIVLASTTGASPAPNYLAGSEVPPSIALPANSTLAASRGARTATASTAMSPGTSAPARIPAAPNYVPPPHTNFPWSYGDPLFCGMPRQSETDDAIHEAHKLGPPKLAQNAAGMRVLIVGDSTACSLYPGLKAVGDEVGADVYQAAVFGCGVASGQITTTRGEQITPHTERCPFMVDEAVTPAIHELRPQIVVWMSIWEKSDLVVGNQTLVSGTPAGNAAMLARMNAELAHLTVYGAKVVVLTEAAAAPNDAQGVDNTSNSVDNASYVRLNTILEEFAEQNRGQVTLVDLAAQICPNGPPCPEDVDGLRLRPDGRHFTPTAASIEARWLMPQLVAVASR